MAEKQRLEDREDSVAEPSQRMYLVELSAKTSAEHNQFTVEAKRARREQERAQKNVESTHWSVFTIQVFFFWLPLNQEYTISDTCSARPNHMCNTHRHTRMAQCEASYACVLLV